MVLSEEDIELYSLTPLTWYSNIAFTNSSYIVLTFNDYFELEYAISQTDIILVE